MVFLYILTYFTLEITQFQVSNSTLLIKFQNQTFILKYCFWILLHFYIFISKSYSLYDCVLPSFICSVSHIFHTLYYRLFKYFINEIDTSYSFFQLGHASFLLKLNFYYIKLRQFMSQLFVMWIPSFNPLIYP